MILIIFSASSSFGQPENQSENATASTPNLSYIWSITGIEEGPVIMALKQEESDLYGQAKYEPDSGQAWNGVVVGSVHNNSVNLVLTALREEDEFSCRLTGTYDPASEMMTGDLVRVTNGEIMERSQFQAMWINPDISSFKPAEIAAKSSTLSSTGKDGNSSATQAQANSQAAGSMAASSSSSQETKYHDVREDADRILTGVGDISQIPIGMGGSGVGGSGMH
jgi:hypothetical protein